jgi:hypothetical protein
MARRTAHRHGATATALIAWALFFAGTQPAPPSSAARWRDRDAQLRLPWMLGLWDTLTRR